MLSAAYTLFFFNRITFGTFSPYLVGNRDLTRREVGLLLPLVVLPVILGIQPSFITDITDAAIERILI